MGPSKREQQTVWARDDHGRLVRVAIDDFNDGKPKLVRIELLERKDSGAFVAIPLEHVEPPDAAITYLDSQERVAKRAFAARECELYEGTDRPNVSLLQRKIDALMNILRGIVIVSGKYTSMLESAKRINFADSHERLTEVMRAEGFLHT